MTTKRFTSSALLGLTVLVALLPLLASGGGNGASSSSTKAPPSAYEYTPVTSLNKYGRSTQLRNAGSASSRYGALVLVGVALTSDKEEVVVCCTLPHAPLNPLAVRPRDDRPCSVHVIATDDDSTVTAVVASGFGPDAVFVVAALREHARRSWERYDAAPSAHRVAEALTELSHVFLGYDRADELCDGAGPVVPLDDKDENPISRPFGLRTLVLGLEPRGRAVVYGVDPTGEHRRPHVVEALGKDGDAAHKLLRAQWNNKKTRSVDEVRALFVDVVREVRFAEEDPSDDDHLVCEILSRHGLNVTRLPLRNTTSILTA